jgi:predicted SnoaL-like aldol condensation-catalyzing enzyme
MGQTIESKNKALVLEAFDTLFNKRDYEAAERYWSPNYIQHSAHIPPGRDGLFNLIKSIPPTLRYESGTVVAEGDSVILHGRYSGLGLPLNWIVADIVRMKDGILVEHWDVIQDEATRAVIKERSSHVRRKIWWVDVLTKPVCNRTWTGLRISVRQVNGSDQSVVSSGLDWGYA